jgi:hypothetical protein
MQADRPRRNVHVTTQQPYSGLRLWPNLRWPPNLEASRENAQDM